MAAHHALLIFPGMFAFEHGKRSSSADQLFASIRDGFPREFSEIRLTDKLPGIIAERTDLDWLEDAELMRAHVFSHADHLVFFLSHECVTEFMTLVLPRLYTLVGADPELRCRFRLATVNQLDVEMSIAQAAETISLRTENSFNHHPANHPDHPHQLEEAGINHAYSTSMTSLNSAFTDPGDAHSTSTSTSISTANTYNNHRNTHRNNHHNNHPAHQSQHFSQYHHKRELSHQQRQRAMQGSSESVRTAISSVHPPSKQPGIARNDDAINDDYFSSVSVASLNQIRVTNNVFEGQTFIFSEDSYNWLKSIQAYWLYKSIKDAPAIMAVAESQNGGAMTQHDNSQQQQQEEDKKDEEDEKVSVKMNHTAAENSDGISKSEEKPPQTVDCKEDKVALTLEEEPIQIEVVESAGCTEQIVLMGCADWTKHHRESPDERDFSQSPHEDPPMKFVEQSQQNTERICELEPEMKTRLRLEQMQDVETIEQSRSGVSSSGNASVNSAHTSSALQHQHDFHDIPSNRKFYEHGRTQIITGVGFVTLGAAVIAAGTFAYLRLRR